MTALMEQVCKEAMELPLNERFAVVHRILEESESTLSREQVEREWDGVIRERMAHHDCGQAKSRPAGEVLSALDKRQDRCSGGVWRVSQARKWKNA